MKIKCSIVFFALLFLILGSITHALNEQSSNEGSSVKVLVLTDNIYGGSLNVSLVDSERGRIIESIFNQFKRFGWEIDIISVSDSISPCKYAGSFFGKKPLKPDRRLGDDVPIKNYDVLMVGPGNFYENLINNPSVHNIVQSALHHNLVIASWCRGLQVLAAAGIIKDKIVIGHIDHEEAYQKAGADYIKYEIINPQKREFKNMAPPLADGSIITTVRSRYYRDQMCQLIKNAVDRKKHKIQHKIDFPAQPDWSINYGLFATGILMEDVNLDGWKDLIISNGLDIAPQPVSIFYNHYGKYSQNSYWQSRYSIPAGNIFVADLDANEFPDLVVSHLGQRQLGFKPGNHCVFFNDMNFKRNPQWESPAANGFSCTGGDFDGDGDMDLVFGQGCNAIKKEDKKFQKTVIFRNDNGQFAANPYWESDSIYLINDVSAVDIDNDGDLDLAISGKGYGISLFVNDNGRLETTPSWQTNSIIGARQMAFGDLDNDGFQELAVAAPGKDFGKGGCYYLFDNKNGTLSKEPFWECDLYKEPSAVQWGDVDADGDLDLVGCGIFSTLGIFENKNGKLSDRFTYEYTEKGEQFFGQQITLGDFDEDYILDRIQTNEADGRKKLFFIGKNIHEIPFIRIGERILDKNEYCCDLQEGWISLKEAPSKNARFQIYYRFSQDLDIAVSALYKVCVFQNRNAGSPE
ncbi:MAG: VCBS repeat-containing protein [Candidatus Aminicenantes bacterium]|nr:VCBS repeat-containing protein [Candidatus Aminicenantes bacterium]